MTAAESTGTLGELGESAALARIFPRLPAAFAQLLGPGDDAAILAAPDGRFVVTTDMMIHGPDFRLAWSTPHDLGWKAAATNLSDLAAMGAVGTGLVVAIAAPASTPVEVLEGIADGLREACSALAPACGVVGGDLSVSATLTIAVTAFGDLEGRAPVLRSGARVGDVVAVSGGLGVAAAGLRILFRDGVVDGEPDAAAAAALRSDPSVAFQLAPVPPIADGPRGRRSGRDGDARSQRWTGPRRPAHRLGQWRRSRPVGRGDRIARGAGRRGGPLAARYVPGRESAAAVVPGDRFRGAGHWTARRRCGVR